MSKRKPKAIPKRVLPGKVDGDQLTDQEAALVLQHEDRAKQRPSAPTVKLYECEGSIAGVEPGTPKHEVWRAGLEETFGTMSWDVARGMLGEVILAVKRDPDELPDDCEVNSALAVIHGIQPRDEIEGMLAAQMYVTHRAAMSCLYRAQLSGQTFEGRDMNLRHGNKLLRSYAAQMEALSRYRGKGQQKVTVEHVHVYKGGQAVVGTVEAGGKHQGGGDAAITEGQAHALTYAPGTPMPCPDAERDAVPVARGEGKEAVSNARRR